MKSVFLSILLTLALLLPDSHSARAQDYLFEQMAYSQIALDDGSQWRSDWPEAQAHFTAALVGLTRVDVAPDGALVRTNGNSGFDYPWRFVVYDLGKGEQIPGVGALMNNRNYEK